MSKFVFFYNDKNALSHNEIDLYKELKPNIEFIDINSDAFKPYANKVSLVEIRSNRVVIDESGKVIKGFDALTEAWKRIPKMAFLIPIITSFSVKPFAKVAFSVYKSKIS